MCFAVALMRVCWVIGKQPFTKLCSDPAQALQMPPQTYLPTGMEGVITCPAASQPPLLRIDWTKDGEPLDLSMVLKHSFLPSVHANIRVKISLHTNS